MGSVCGKIDETELTVSSIDSGDYKYPGYTVIHIREGITRFSFNKTYGIFLSKSNPDYARLYESLKPNGVYKFKYRYDNLYDGDDYINGIITGISPPDKKTFTMNVNGIVSLKHDNSYKEYSEILGHKDFNGRLICDEHILSQIYAGKTYELTAIKCSPADFKVLSAELVINSINP